MNDVRFPKVEVKLTGRDGNAFVITGAVRAALRKAGATDDECAEFTAEATSGDYDHLLATACRWVVVS